MTLRYRTTAVGAYDMNTLSHGSQLQFGDTYSDVHLRNRVLAIQRGIARFEGDELRFASYPLFFLPNPVPLAPPGASIRSTSRTGTIKIGAVRILAATASSLIRAGDGYGPHTAESRIQDIRHFNDPKNWPRIRTWADASGT